MPDLYLSQPLVTSQVKHTSLLRHRRLLRIDRKLDLSTEQVIMRMIDRVGCLLFARSIGIE